MSISVAAPDGVKVGTCERMEPGCPAEEWVCMEPPGLVLDEHASLESVLQSSTGLHGRWRQEFAELGCQKTAKEPEEG